MSRTRKPAVVELPGGAGDEAAIARAAEVMAEGGLVAFPTDTVYGLAADPSRLDAAERICAAKRRARSKPIARLVADADAAAPIAGSWPRLARKLARVYWPGALTIVVNDVGLRVPGNQLARALAVRMGGSILATSANRSGGPEPRTARDVAAALGPEVDLILDGGRAGGVPSTVVRVAGERLEVLREGAIGEEALRSVAPPTVLFVCRGNTCRSPLAAAMFTEEALKRKRADLRALSAGLDVIGDRGGDSVDQGASKTVRRVAVEMGFVLAGHEVTALTPAMLSRADWVFVMEGEQIGKITSFLPEEADRVRLLDPAGEDVPDPAGGGAEVYRATGLRIRSLVRVRAREILDAEDA